MGDSGAKGGCRKMLGSGGRRGVLHRMLGPWGGGVSAGGRGKSLTKNNRDLQEKNCL